MHAVGALRLVELRQLALAQGHGPHAGAHHDAHALRRHVVHAKVGVAHGFLGGDQRELRVAVEAIGGGVEMLAGHEIADARGHPAAIALDGKPLDVREAADAGASGQGGLPEGVDPDADRGDHTEARDDDSCLNGRDRNGD